MWTYHINKANVTEGISGLPLVSAACVFRVSVSPHPCHPRTHSCSLKLRILYAFNVIPRRKQPVSAAARVTGALLPEYDS